MATVDGSITGFEARTSEQGHHCLHFSFTIQVTDPGESPDPVALEVTYPVDLLEGRTLVEAKDVVVNQGYGGVKPLADFKQEVLDLYEATGVLRGVSWPVAF